MEISQELKDKIYFVIPVYNEAKMIEKVVNKLLYANYSKLVLVNDGSTDNTGEVLERLMREKGIVYLEHVINRGQGAALKTGIDYAKEQSDCKYIVNFDADDQHKISDLPKFISVLETGKYDIVLGSRFLIPESKKLVPLKKKVLLKGGVVVTMFLSGIMLSDVHNGYRVMTKRAANLIDITMDRFEHASEILDEIVKKKIKYKEVPVVIDYTAYSKQKGQKMSNSFKILLKMLLKKH